MEKTILVPDAIWTVSSVLSPSECADFITQTEERHYDEAPITTARGFVMKKEIRNNTRVMIDDAATTTWLWERLKPFAPPLWERRDAVGLNERLRFYRYDVGQYFAPHYDGCFQRNELEWSALTMMIYLNDDFEGGETNFDLKYPYGAISVKPKSGMALFFDHYLRHEGATITKGRKYVLRSDVMYRVA